MWYLGDDKAIYNLDYVRSIFIIDSSRLSSNNPNRNMRKFAICLEPYNAGGWEVLKTFDRYEDADMEMAMLLQRLRRNEWRGCRYGESEEH